MSGPMVPRRILRDLSTGSVSDHHSSPLGMAHAPTWLGYSVSHLPQASPLGSPGQRFDQCPGYSPHVELTPSGPEPEEWYEDDDVDTAGALLHMLSDIPPPNMEQAPKHQQQPGSEAGNSFSWQELEISCQKLDEANITISQIDLTCILDSGDAQDATDSVKYDFHVEKAAQQAPAEVGACDDGPQDLDSILQQDVGELPIDPLRRLSVDSYCSSADTRAFFEGDMSPQTPPAASPRDAVYQNKATILADSQNSSGKGSPSWQPVSNQRSVSRTSTLASYMKKTASKLRSSGKV